MKKKEKVEKKVEEKEITPSQYFDYLKNAKNEITTEALKNSYDVFLKLAEKYNKLGQKESMKKLCFLAETLKKEEKLIEMGINTYVYKDTIEDYIENVADKAVKIIELSRYMREIPDELVDTIEKTKEIFDELYVVFTDYTGKVERQVNKERRDKDPILFGVFKNESIVSDRFYFLGDWVDEFCDLTLDKMVEQYESKKGTSPAMTTEIPKNSDELVEILKSYKIDEKRETNNYIIPVSHINNEGLTERLYLDNYTKTNVPEENKNGFFQKIRSVFSKNK